MFPLLRNNDAPMPIGNRGTPANDCRLPTADWLGQARRV